MKKYFLLLAILPCALLFTSCRMNVLKGEGAQGNITPQLPPFNAVVVDLPVNTTVRMQAGVQPSVQLSGYKNILQHIKTEVKDNTLHIYSDLDETWQMEPDGTDAQVTLPLLTALAVNGSGDVHVQGPVTGSVLDIDLSGSGDIKVDNVTVDSISAILSGSGDIHINGGVVKNAEYEVNGSGELKTAALTANNAWATVDGSGSIIANAVQHLDAKINGSGVIRYTGHPQVAQSINGSGEISND